MAAKPKICFVGLKCYDLLVGADTPRYIGGIENQLVLLGQVLAERGYPVSFVTFDHGQPDGIEHEGIRIFKAFGSNDGLPIVRFVYPRWTGLWSALARANADIYYQMGAGCETGQVAMYSRKNAKRFMFATASDADCDPHLPFLKSKREKYLFRYGRKRADLVISQTRRQQELLVAYYGIASEQLGIFTRDWGAQAPIDACRRRILWVGRISPEKRPHLLLEIAHLAPDLQIDVIGDANAETEYACSFRRAAQGEPSITLHGKVSGDILHRLYSEAAVLINTSQTEGFPVTFIEAWSRGTPVISTFDPDGMIASNNLGRVASDLGKLVQNLRELMSNSEELRSASQSARSYYMDKHSTSACVRRFTNLLDSINWSDPCCNGIGV